MDIAAYLQSHKDITLSEAQRAAVTHPGGLLLLAVPGAGKTTVVAARIAHLLLNKGISASALRTLTFSREGARDMERRFNGLFGELVPKSPAFSTIHAFCYRLLRRQAGRAGLPELLTDGGQAEIFRGLFREASGRFGDDDFIDSLARCYGLILNRLERPEARHNTEFGIPGLNELCLGYERYKAEHGLMDFDDMLTGALQLLRSRPQLTEALKKATPYLLLDEAQDTTALQHAIIEEIAQPERLFMVGDEDQSIYGFRGTSTRLMLNLPERYPGIAVLKTEESFRLTPQVCAAAERLIGLSANRFDKQLYTARPDGPPVEYLPLKEGEDQGEVVARRLQALSPGERAAVLYRNNPSAFGVADALSRAGIDFYIREQKIRLKRLGIVADLLSFFALSYNPGDLNAFSRVYYKMGAYISRQMLDFALGNTPAGGSVFDTLCDAPTEGMSTARVVYAGRQIARLRGLPSPRALEVMLDDLGYLDFLTQRAGGGLRLEQDAQLLDALRSIALRYPKVEDFLDRIDQLDDLLAQHADHRNAPVTLSTIHSTKGMEFDHVLVVDFLDGVLPSAQAIGEAAEGNHAPLEEEVRLGYVAVTRAIRSLCLICPTAIGERTLTPSRFIPVLMGKPVVHPEAAHPLVGRQVEHRFFGIGEITAVNEPGRSFTAHFGKLGSKLLHLSVLDNTRIIKMLEP